MKNRVAIIICYFGRLPNIFPLWLQSCTRNSQFDFLLFTDQNVDSPEKNIHIELCTLEDIRQLAIAALNQSDVSLSHAYKLCDYKPMYGVIFQSYLKGYDFWGMCDMDMVFGNLGTFITDELLDSNEKIYQLGHLTLYRNTDEVNRRYELPGYCDWQEAIHTESHCRLCERGMMKKYHTAGLKVYDVRDYADISKVHRRYQLSRWLVPSFDRDRYRNQLFYCDNGHIYRAILQDGHIFTQEFVYIHLQKRKLFAPPEGLGECYYITNNRFISKEHGIPSEETIRNLNPYRGKLFELLECAEFEFCKRYRQIRIHFATEGKK